MANSKKTYTFKVVGDCEIQADVYSAGEETTRPVIVWIHGGALMVGGRDNILEQYSRFYTDAGYTVVSIDYRLAPETKLNGIIEDVQDAFKWVRERGPELFNIDPERVAVLGGSAGGYLTLMTGFCIEPRPQALISFYGYGDIAGPWLSQPEPGYCQWPAVPKDEAYSAVGTKPITQAADPEARGRLYLYTRQHGLWPLEVTGHDPHKEPEVFDAYCPLRNVTPEYPPTLLIHGTADGDVPYSLSVKMAEELARAGVEHELITIPNGIHGFELVEGAMAHPVVAGMLEKVLAFLAKHIG